MRFFRIVLERTEDGDFRELHSNPVKFPAQIAHIAAHVVADDHGAILKIPENLFCAVREHFAVGKLAQLVYAQAMHLSGIAVDGLCLKIHVLSADAPSFNNQVGQLDDAAGMHAVQFYIQCNHLIRFFEQIL